ncbi:MAG: hypothetical protein AB1717_08790 [Pseudomonadota bacterium]
MNDQHDGQPRNEAREPVGEVEQTLILREEMHYRTPLEGEVLPEPGEQFDRAARQMSKPFNALWWLSLGMTLWLVWLTLHGDPGGLMNILLAVVLSLPFLILSAARLGLANVFSLLRQGVEQAHAMPKNAADWQDTLRNAHSEARKAKASDWVGAAWKANETVGGMRDTLQLLMLTPKFFAALALALLATLIMIPVTLFTLLLAIF